MDLIAKRRTGGGVTPYSSLDDLLTRFSGLMRMPTIEHLPEAFTRNTFPDLEAHETGDAFCVDLDLPGIDREDVTVELAGTQLRIHGERRWEKTRKKHRDGGTHTEEGRFDYSVSVPADIKFDADAIRAKLEKGVLQIEIPKIEPTPAKRIEIEER